MATISNNSVLVLRAKQLGESRREFKARGAKLTRCERCLLAEHYCICEGVQQAECEAAVCLLGRTAAASARRDQPPDSCWAVRS